MHKAKKNNQKASFFRRYGWGLFCALCVIAVWVITARTSIAPSGSFGGITFFAEVKDKAAFRIVAAPDLFRMLLKDGRFLTYSERGNIRSNFPYAVSREGNDAIVNGLSLMLSKKEIDRLWSEEPVVSVHQNKDGSYEVSYALDAIGQTIRGIYQVKDGTVVKHYFEQTDFSLAMFISFFIFAVYLLVSISRVFVRFVKKRKQSRQQTRTEQ